MRFVDSYDRGLSGKLNETERIFKAFFEENRALMPECPHNLSAYDTLINYASSVTTIPFYNLLFQERLEETTFFTTDNDIEIYRHLRYLPCSWHSHDFLEIICVVQGSCTHYIAEQKLEMQEGDICIVAPDTRHAISAFSDESLILNILIRVSTFETAFFGTLIDDSILSRFFHHTLYQSKTYPYLLFCTGSDQALFNFVGYAFDEASHNNAYKKRMLNCIITGFFVMLLRNHGADVIVSELTSPEQNQNVFYVLQYMQKHFATTSLPDMAATFNYSERQIQRIVAEATGLSFSANILKLKMSQADRLLTNSDMSVANIAESLGYADTRSFRQTFKKYFGKTPGDYRKKDAP